MPPKKNMKSKSKRYSCNLCAGIDNNLMIQCDDCDDKYHLKCLNIDGLDKNDDWVCNECLQKDLSRLPKSIANISKSNGSKIDFIGNQSAGHVSRKSEVNDNPKKGGQNNQSRFSQHSERISQSTRSSARRRTQLELERLEEERTMQEKRDKEYLDSKYRILMEERSDRTERTESERRSTDRSSYTREWLLNQSVEVQPPSLPHNSKMELTLEGLKSRFEQKIDETRFENTSPPERHQRPLLRSNETDQENTLTAPRWGQIPCPKHDARNFTVQERGSTKSDGISGAPCSNSTFAMQPKPNTYKPSDREKGQRLRNISPGSVNHQTLEWDNYVGTMNDKGKTPKHQPDKSSAKSYGKEDMSTSKENLGKNPKPQMDQMSFRSNEKEDTFGTKRYESGAQQANWESSKERYGSTVTYEDAFEETDDERSRQRFKKNQSYRRVEFEETDGIKPSSNLNDKSHPKINYSSSFRSNGDALANQMVARQVVEKKLPIFDGDPYEWPIWHRQYENSTDLCGFSNGENLDRLQKCLKGKARDSVRGHLMNPDSVPLIIDTLAMLYGRPEIIIKAVVDKARERQPIKPDRIDELIDFALEVQTISSTIESLKRNNYFTDPTLVNELVDKLPTQEKKDWARFKAGKPNVTLKTLAVWLYDLVKLLSTVSSPRVTKPNDRKPEKEKSEKNEKAIGLEHVNVHQMNNNVSNGYGRKGPERTQRSRFPCPICNNKGHRVENCSKFKSFDIDARYKAKNEHKLCRRCLQKHKDPCRATNVCGKNGCPYKHHFLLHNDERHTPPASNSMANTTIARSNFHAGTTFSTMLRIVPVVLYNGNKSVATFAFFDDGTTVTMMEKWIANELGLKGTAEQICLIWTKKIHRQERAERVSLEISGVNGFNKRYGMKEVRTVDSLNLPTQSINKKELVENYPYLKGIPFLDYTNALPGIMIGSDMPRFGTQLEVVESEDVENNDSNSPTASRTRLGWSVHGPRKGSSNIEHVNIHQFEVCTYHNDLDNEIHQRVKEYFSVENFGVQASSKANLESKDDERALEMLNQLTRKRNNKYETGLLWKNDAINLPDSYPMALKRLISLERQGEEMVRTLGAKISDYVAKGYAKKLSKKELEYDGPVWYLPLFGVVHPKKPGKIRMVFDAAAKVKSVSLNSVLLKGPDLYTSLIDILRRFRERLYTGGGDIEEMFHQIYVIEKDRHYQRFLYRENNSREPDIYEMDVLTFGANCSPCSAQFVKNKNAREFIKSHPRAVSAIIDNHYVDDMMESEHSEKEMIKLLEDVRMIHAKGGFRIRNFISNSKEVLRAIGENESTELKDISLKSELKVERILGMWYNTKSDVFTFSLKYTPISEDIFNGSKLPTKREVLRMLMSIFDPLGLLTNFLIYLKIILQDVWRTQMDWDEQLSSEELVERWRKWLSILPEVESVSVPRLYSTKMSPNDPKSIEMHVFVDASEDAFAAVVYLRIEDEDGTDVAFAGSKARVAPLKYLSIPRKELQGSVLGIRLSTSIKGALRLKIDRRIIWTDSSTVISWLNSDHRKYSQFVAHRVGEILENSDVHEWRWIPTKDNVADEATKWTKVPNFDPSNRWFRGPEFLRQSEDKWPKKKPISTDVEEEMKANFLHSSLIIPRIIDPERFSSYKRMVRSLAYAIRFINLFTGKAKKGEPLKQEELRKAENLIFRQAQFEGYPTEMVTLERNNVLPAMKRKFIEKPSPLYDGTPYIDADGILRMKRRIDGARDLSMDTKRPIVLPKDSRITKLLLLGYHSNFFHQNHETVVNEVRQKFYIPRLREVLKKSRKDCQMCKIKKAHPHPPQMADLPTARLATRFIPYSFVGIDFFGPMFVAVGRRKEKRWGVLFTCLTIRAIHIEIAPGLDTNSCILCIQNFVADHGPVIEFHSDCGTNFKGSDKVLQEEIDKIDPERLQTEFTTTYTKWIFNPPASPHMGGSWERLIRTVKSAINEVMPTRTPKEDMLRNLLKQIQNVVNSRPLTYIPLDVEEDEALTPNHFIKLSSSGLKPPCKIELDGPYLRESWKESQRLTEFFWKRFIDEYLPTIARRTKWHKPMEPLKPGDLVLVVDPNNPRNTYPKAKILRTQIGSNGQARRAKVELISSTMSNSKGQICKVNKIELWRSTHKLALLDVACRNGLAQGNRETGGSVATNYESNTGAESSRAVHSNSTRLLDRSMATSVNVMAKGDGN